MRVRLLWVEGDGAAEFADLIGCEGSISRKGQSMTFLPDGRGDWLTLRPVKEVSRDGRWRVTSRAEITYVFKIL